MPLRRLLSQHQYICERILDEQEIEVGSGHTKEDLGVDASWRLVRACDTAGRWIRSGALFSLEPFAKAVWYWAPHLIGGAIKLAAGAIGPHDTAALRRMKAAREL